MVINKTYDTSPLFQFAFHRIHIPNRLLESKPIIVFVLKKLVSFSIFESTETKLSQPDLTSGFL